MGQRISHTPQRLGEDHFHDGNWGAQGGIGAGKGGAAQGFLIVKLRDVMHMHAAQHFGGEGLAALVRLRISEGFHAHKGGLKPAVCVAFQQKRDLSGIHDAGDVLIGDEADLHVRAFRIVAR